MNKMNTNKKKVLDQLQKSKGTITTACINSGISRTSFYEYYNQDAEFRANVIDIQEASIDHVEGKLMEKIDEGDTTAIIFYLKTKGRKRGYSERLALDEMIKLIQVNGIDYSMLTDETIQELIGSGKNVLELLTTPKSNFPDWLR